MSEKKRGLFEAEGRVPQLRSSGEKRSEPRSGEVMEAGVFLVTSLSIAVGMAVTRHPPHRSGRALLTHPVPTLGVWRRNVVPDKDVRP